MTEPVLPDPAPRFVAAYRAIAQRLQGLNFVNPAIDVEAVGFAPWGSHWLGVMVTPWFINLMLLPREQPVAHEEPLVHVTAGLRGLRLFAALGCAAHLGTVREYVE